MRHRVLLALAAGALLSGCTMKSHGIPAANPEFAKADYTVLGKTNHEECGTYILGIDFGHLFSNQKASTTAGGAGGIAGLIAGLMPSGSPEESRALYHALDKMPEATHLMAHRSHTTTSGVVFFGHPIFGERCASVEARGVRIENVPAGKQGFTQPPA